MMMDRFAADGGRGWGVSYGASIAPRVVVSVILDSSMPGHNAAKLSD